MDAAKPGILSAVLIGGIALSGCFLDPRARDEYTVRQQFRLPDKIAFVAFEHAPKSMRPEGLRIEATVEFTAEQFEDYRSRLDDPSVWKPVALYSYSPAIGESYSESAMRWKALPVPVFPGEWRKHWEMIDVEPGTIRNGRYFCSTLRMIRGEPFKSNPEAFRSVTIGEACEELPPGEWPTVAMFGILDFDRQALHVLMQFSG